MGEESVKAKLIPGMNPSGSTQLPTIDFVKNRRLGETIQKSNCVKGMLITGEFLINCTWSAGAPGAPKYGALQKLLKNVVIEADKETLIKCSPLELRNTTKLVANSASQPRYQTNSTTLTASATKGLMAWGTTGQNVKVKESLYIPLECHFLTEPWLTYLNAARYDKCQVFFDFDDPTGLDEGAAATNFAVVSCTGTIDVTLVTSDEDVDKEFEIYRRGFSDNSFGGVTPGKRIDLKQVDGDLLGVFIEVNRVTSAGVETPVTQNEAKNMFFTLKLNGSLAKKQKMSLAQIMDENENKFPIGGSLDNFGFMTFIQGSDRNSVIKMRDYKTVDMEMEMTSGLDFSSSATYKVRTHTHELVPVALQRKLEPKK
ncbi:MAG: hypothetical protein A2X86_10365 [Bdellovibrionales bacterium GWA2_49_15]|nr:MAG: hypothetical protein A2X86_10365 [Bdellovibrionales bacterium GWA2_49_15]